MDFIKEKTVEKFLSYGNEILGTVILIVIGLLVTKLVLKITKKALSKSRLDEAMHKFIITALKYTMYVLVLIIVLTSLNVPTAPLLTVLGAGGAAIALALKDSLGNIASGVIILAHRPFGKGDEIEVAGTSGIVQSIDVMLTTIKTFDNKVITIPNSTITSSILTNYSREEIRRVDIDFLISYESDSAKAKDVILAIVETFPLVLKEPEARVLISGYMESGVSLTLRAWCSTENYYNVKAELVEQVRVAFKEADITIPYPHMDIRVVK